MGNVELADEKRITEGLEEYGNVLPTGMSRDGTLAVVSVVEKQGEHRLMWYDDEPRTFKVFPDGNGFGSVTGISEGGSYLCGVKNKDGKEHMFRYQISNEQITFATPYRPRQPYGVNENGVMVGFGNDKEDKGRGFWAKPPEEGRYLGTGRLFALNEDGLATGSIGGTAITYDTKTERLVPLQKPSNNGSWAKGFGLDSQGQFVAGTYRESKGGPWRPGFWRTESGDQTPALQPILGLDGQPFMGLALDVNRHGIVVGVKLSDVPVDWNTQSPRRKTFTKRVTEDGVERIVHAAEAFYCSVEDRVAHPIPATWFFSDIGSACVINDDYRIAGYYLPTRDSAVRPYTAKMIFKS